MGYDCSATVAGDSLSELLNSVKAHALEHHGYTGEEVDSPERIAIWQGAIKQSARPGSLRTHHGEFDRDVKPH
ncbi:MAG: DUF1059 domain-containing protein [Chloroflexi bacterium]|nr:DUF1059 domain-containing protein [Chloroflexota bacterium]